MIYKENALSFLYSQWYIICIIRHKYMYFVLKKYIHKGQISITDQQHFYPVNTFVCNLLQKFKIDDKNSLYVTS